LKKNTASSADPGGAGYSILKGSKITMIAKEKKKVCAGILLVDSLKGRIGGTSADQTMLGLI